LTFRSFCTFLSSSSLASQTRNYSHILKQETHFERIISLRFSTRVAENFRHLSAFRRHIRFQRAYSITEPTTSRGAPISLSLSLSFSASILREGQPHLYGYEETEDFRSPRAKRVVVKRARIHSLSERGARSSFRRLVRCRPPTCRIICIDPCTRAICLRGIYLHTGFAIGDDTEDTFSASRCRRGAESRRRAARLDINAMEPALNHARHRILRIQGI